MFNLNPELNTEVLEILAKRFGSGIRIREVTRLTAPERRNLVLRIALEPSSDVNLPNSVILKQSFIQEGADAQQLFDRFARDWAGLEFASKVPDDKRITPEFYGASLKHRFVLQQDFGHDHQSLVEPLTSHDREAAMTALRLYMQRMAQFHANGFNRTEEYKKSLRLINPQAKAWPNDLDQLFSATTESLKNLGLSFSEESQELRSVFNAMQQPGPFSTLIHGDICPDNLFYNAKKDSLHFIDFEWSFLGNAIMDMAVIRMSMPTGWCVKAFKKDDVEHLEQVYKRELEKALPGSFNNDQYNYALVAACAYWMVIQTAFIMQEVIEHERDISDPKRSQPHPNWKPEDNLKRPQCLYRLQAFINIASEHNAFPHLKMMAENVLQQLKLRWPNTKELEVFPAFKAVKQQQCQATLSGYSGVLFAHQAKEPFFKPPSLQPKLVDSTRPDSHGPGAIVPYSGK